MPDWFSANNYFGLEGGFRMVAALVISVYGISSPLIWAFTHMLFEVFVIDGRPLDKKLLDVAVPIKKEEIVERYGKKLSYWTSEEASRNFNL